VLECDPRLETLFRRSFDSVRVHGASRDGRREWLLQYPDVKAQIPIGSLPRHLRNSAEDFPKRSGYLQADPKRIAQWKKRLRELPGTLRVGLAWRGGTVKTRSLLRSVELAALEVVFSQRDVGFVCLQHDVRDEEALRLKKAGVLVPDRLTEIEETAALTQALDLVVSVPSTAAHLAGALDVPLFLMLGSMPEWRWQYRGTQTPWYPQARLFRQEQAFEWSCVVDDVAREIEAMIRGGDPRHRAS
jgi:hypothetical protein